MAIFRITGENPRVFEGEKFVRVIRSLYTYSPKEYADMKRRMDKRFRCKDDDGVVYF